MERPIESVDIVSDGILVRFSDGVLTYFPHQFLRDHIGTGSNQIFVDDNPADPCLIPRSLRTMHLVS